jgi:hypothetical protein
MDEPQQQSVEESSFREMLRRAQGEKDYETHQLPEEEDEPECGRPSDRCLRGAASVSIHRGHRRRERIPVPEDATAGLCGPMLTFAPFFC